jgi:DNA adenine methylase
MPTPSRPTRQASLFDGVPHEPAGRQPPQGQLLKWVGSKQRFAAAIAALLPHAYGRYIELFTGSAAVLATMAPERGIAADVLGPLVALWQAVQREPDTVVGWYTEGWQALMTGDKVAAYRRLRDRYNAAPNPADLLVLTRSCYGGVIRFARDGSMNTPCGAHRPIDPDEFAVRLARWRPRLQGVQFVHSDFEPVLDSAESGDVVYCDPPYLDSAATLYGAQGFQFARLVAAMARAKDRGVRVALSIDGTKRSGSKVCAVPLPEGLFETEATVDVGRSMLRRFQLAGQTLEREVVSDRLLLTWVAKS